MRIKQLELTGFKSFLDKTKFEFNAPITTIVGPNGCGKSNVVDALKWISGELSYKELRGRSMEDLIFAGSDRRAPTSMMEVTLVLSNENKTAPAQYNQYDEITLQRRIFRDGSSEFFINKIPCRLRDITDMFLDTGIGQSSYSIIEQGKVGTIVSGRPEDRRLMIEEAAGITKYKSRKKAAERKIEYTKQNLLRVTDIVAELKKQIASLERQAKKAEEYRLAQGKAKEVDLAISSREYEDLKNNSKETLERETQLLDLITQEETKLAQDESVFETKRLELDEIEKTFQSSQQNLFSAKSVIQQIENNIETHQRDLVRLTESLNEEKAKDSFLVQETVRINQKIQETKSLIDSLEQETLNFKNNLNDKQTTCADYKSVVSQVETDLESQKTLHIELVTQEAQLGSLIASANQQRKTLEEDLAQIIATSEQLQTEAIEKETLYQAQKDNVDQANQLSFSFEENQNKTRERLQQLEIEETLLETDLAEVQKKLDACISKLNALQEFARTYQGYTKSVQSLMKNRDQLGNIHGVLGEMIKPKRGYEKAVQASLSELIECVLVDHPEDAMNAISYLKDVEKNRGMFLASNGTKRNQVARIQHEKILGTVLDFVEIQSTSSKEVLSSILNNTFVVQGSFKDAFEIWNQTGHCNLVTVEGDFISMSGIIHAGPWSEAKGDMEVRQQIDELKVEIEPLKSRRDELALQQNQLHKDIGFSKNTLEDIRMDLERHSKVSLNLAKELEKLNNTVDFLNQKKQENQVRREKIETSLNNLQNTTQETQQILDQALAKKQDIETSISSVSEKLSVSREQYQKYVDDLNEYQVKIASSFEKLEGLKRDHEASVQLLQYTEDEKTKNASLIQKHEEEIVQLKTGLDQLSTDKLEKVSDFQKIEVTNSELQSNHDIAVNSIRELESQLKQTRLQKETLASSLNEVRIKISECSLRMENLQKQVLERYETDLLDFLAQPTYQSITDEQHSEFKIELEKLKEKIVKFGNVNLAAIEEVDQLRERYDFLNNQREDLEKSLESLIDAIKKINRTTREKFETTFNEVNERFQKVFPRLFRGGKAKLMLTDPENVLESGVDIFAQPPGKKLQNMNLLSGGEKALTAISLLFAIFEHKAPPFCVLDEVDAPLDDANVLRFVSIVKEMSQQTQFIVITHNKNTMEMANNLYGVTMEEPGVSRTVSVRLHQEKALENAEPILEARSVA